VRRLSLRAQILGAFLVSFLVFVLALGMGLARLSSLGDELTVIDVGYLPLARTAAQLESFQARLETDLTRLSRLDALKIPRSAWPAALYAERVREAVDRGVAIVDRAVPQTSRAQERAVLTSIRGRLEIIRMTHAEYAEIGTGFLDLVESGQAELAMQMEGDLLNAQSNLETEIELFSSRVDESIRRVYQRTAQAQRRAVVFSGGMALIALVLGMAMLALSVLALRPIVALTRGVQRIAGGDYDVRLPVGRRDELGILAEETNAMALALQQRGEEAARAEAQRLADRERIARSERLALVGQMLAQITHEVRNPLNALSLNAELLRDEISELPADRVPETEAILATMSEGITHLERVTEHYLALTRHPELVLEPEDPLELARGVARLLEEELRRAGVTLDLSGEALGSVAMDGHQVRGALLNVLRNAVEAGAQQVQLGLSRQSGELRISVADDGPGMTPEELGRALDPFFSTKASGTGLGLAITRQIMEAHGGTILVESDSTGTEVVLTLPA
jgi:two-component system NtrC family sensor kinase